MGKLTGVLLVLTLAAVIAVVAGCPKPAHEGTVGVGPGAKMTAPAGAPSEAGPGNTEAKAAPASQSEESSDEPEPANAEKSRGAADAKVVVQAFYPWSGHGHIRTAIFELADKYPGKVRAELYNWAEKEEDRKVWTDKGLTCGGILINDKQTFRVKDAKGSHDVTLMMAMDGEWTKAELGAIVADQVAKAYPK